MIKKALKIFLANFSIFLFGLLLIEIFFGYWFDENNLGPYMREHRLKNSPVVLTYKNETFNYVYKRNYYGFRGEKMDPSKIEAVIIGGSTTDERYKPQRFTITANLNTLLKNGGYNFEIVNAGIEGQSTFGHIYNFKHWFAKLKGFSPKLFIFYIGINDYGRWAENKKVEDNLGGDGHVLNPDSMEAFLDNFKSRSFFYDRLRRIKHKYYLTAKTAKYDHKFYDDEDLSAFNYTNYEEALKIHDIEHLKLKYKKILDDYTNRVQILSKYVKSYGAKAIFINQVVNEGLKDENLFIHNYRLIEFCKEKNLSYIDLAKKMNGDINYWFDGLHTTTLGSKVISELIIGDLVKIIKKEQIFLIH